MADTTTFENASTNVSVRRGKRLLMMVRRAHLYLGLMLAPWAILYGVTGFLFNHPTYFSDRELRHIPANVVRDCGFDGSLADPSSAAQEVIDVLNQKFPEAKISLLTAVEPKYLGDYFFATSDADQVTHQVLIRRDGGGGTYVSTRKPPPPDDTMATFASAAMTRALGSSSLKSTPSPKTSTTSESSTESNRITIPSGAASEVEALLPQLGNRLAVQGMTQPFKLTSAPMLQFAVKGDGLEWLVKYDSFNGTVNAVKIDSSAPQEQRSWRAFWTRLHTANGYPGVLESRWYWAFMIDATAFVLVFWSISGFVMWWQLKQLRLWGIIAVFVSITAAIMLFSGMSYHL